LIFVSKPLLFSLADHGRAGLKKKKCPRSTGC